MYRTMVRNFFRATTYSLYTIICSRVGYIYRIFSRLYVFKSIFDSIRTRYFVGSRDSGVKPNTFCRTSFKRIDSGPWYRFRCVYFTVYPMYASVVVELPTRAFVDGTVKCFCLHFVLKLPKNEFNNFAYKSLERDKMYVHCL